jgi:hypothetical protein
MIDPVRRYNSTARRYAVRTRKYLIRTSYSLKRHDDLTYLANSFGSDKGSEGSAHLYTRIYRKLFEDVRNDQITILEVGLLRPDTDKRRVINATEGVTNATASKAPSLEMWRAYFPRAKIFGFDIDDFSKVKIDGCQIIRGDMSSREDLVRLISTVGDQFDLVIDDGSHISHHQQIALGLLFPHVRSGGLYIIEDLHWQDLQIEKPEAVKTKTIFRQFLSTGAFESPFVSNSEKTYFEQHVDKLWLFDSLTRDVEDSRDALAVIRKI